MTPRSVDVSIWSPNEGAWALGRVDRGRFKIRRMVWGRALARAERRRGEEIRRARILITGERE